MAKSSETRKKIASLKDQIKKLEQQAKEEERDTFVKLGEVTVEFLRGSLSLEDLKLKALEFGAIDEEMIS